MLEDWEDILVSFCKKEASLNNGIVTECDNVYVINVPNYLTIILTMQGSFKINSSRYYFLTSSSVLKTTDSLCGTTEQVLLAVEWYCSCQKLKLKKK